MKKCSIPILLACLLGFAAQALAQEHYTEGPVWRVNYVSTKPGKFNDSLKDIREHFSKVWADAKAQGVVLDYKVFLNQTSTGPTDWNIATAVLYKNYSALDGLAGKMDRLRSSTTARRTRGLRPGRSARISGPLSPACWVARS